MYSARGDGIAKVKVINKRRAVIERSVIERYAGSGGGRFECRRGSAGRGNGARVWG